MEYAELLCKSNYSFLRAASFPEEMVEEALRLGLKGLALGDWDGLYGLPRAWAACKDKPDFKFICAAQLTVRDRPPLVLLARNHAGYSLLCRLLTLSHAGKEKGGAFLTWQELCAGLQEPAARGLIGLPLEGPGADYGALAELLPGRVFLPLCRLLDGWDRERTQKAQQAGRRFGLPLVACNDAHFHAPQRRVLQDLVTSIREGVPLSRAGYRLYSNAERRLKGPAEMQRLFSDLPAALAQSLAIAEDCSFSLSEIRYQYPSEWIPAGKTAQQFLDELVDQGAAWRYPGGAPAPVRLQLAHEMDLIGRLRFADYFLTIHELVQFARQRGILCQGRGSAANSAVCYCLGITAIDPVASNLLFERFISEERGEPPDIDVDFEHNRREEVIQHLYEKYGRHRAAMVAAVITYRSRLALREVSKALGFDPGDRRQNREGRGVHSPHALVEKLAAQLWGFPRHLSIHSGGFVLCGDSLVDQVPVEPARMEGRTIIQWDKNDLDAVGLLKIDVLSLGMLTALRQAMDLSGIRELADIPAEDGKTYEMIQRTDTMGVFQIESRAQMNMLGRLQPACFYDLVIEVAIVRPGPIVGKMVHPYLKSRRGEKPEFSDPRLHKILSKTLGVPLFQEQIMKLAIELAGFTPGEADRLRRAIGAWRSSGSVEAMGERLRQGLLQSGLPSEFTDRIFEQVKGFAEYGFPESHAASFALLAYASAYLKCHHPAEFTCALINSQPMGFYAVHSLVDDARRHGVEVRPLDPRVSGWDCCLEGRALRLGLRVARGLSEEGAKGILAQREKAPFTSLWDFCGRTRLPWSVLEDLALGNAFACFGLEPRPALWQLLHWRLLAASPQAAQPSLFENLDPAVESPAFKPHDFMETVQQDYRAFGLSLAGHPMQALRRKLGLKEMNSAQAREVPHGGLLTAAGLVTVRQRPGTGKGAVFAVLEDELGQVDLILPKHTYEKVVEVFTAHSFLGVSGVMQRDGHSRSLLVKRVWALWKEEALAAESHDWH